jgi:diguanylate cyclase
MSCRSRVTLSACASFKTDLLAAFDRAVAENNLRLEYQPVLDAATGRVAWVEALLRCPVGDGGYLMNDELLPAIGGSGDRALSLGIHVMRMAIEQALLWKQSGQGVRVAINLMPEQVADEVFLWCLGDELKREGLGSRDLVIEIAEDKPVRAGSPLEAGLRRLADMGLTVALDNFGTGFSNLSHLRDMSVRVLKTDRRFGANLHLENGRRVVEAMSGFCHGLGLELVVVGIENAAAAEVVESLGVSARQGFHFARPMTAQVCTRWLSSAAADDRADSRPGLNYISGAFTPAPTHPFAER